MRTSYKKNVPSVNRKNPEANIIKKGMILIVKKLAPFMVRCSPVLATKILYIVHNGKRLNLKEPTTYHDKFHWLKLYWKNPIKVKCADKYEVRAFVEERDCKEILNELYGVYVNTNEIDWNLLPEKFVLKTTNASGTNIICRDKDTLNKQDTIKKLNKWLKSDYGLREAETFYSEMTPRIICEKYIETEDGMLPNDYKVYCFNGDPKFILAISGRATGNPRMQTYDMEWHELDYVKTYCKGDPDIELRKPRTLSKIAYYSEKLAQGFPYVRVDFYDVSGCTLFGEMTFTPAAGYVTIFNEEAIKLMVDWIELPGKGIQ